MDTDNLSEETVGEIDPFSFPVTRSDRRPVNERWFYAYGAKKKLSATNHICKFVSINDKWVWESASLVESQNKYSDSDHKLLTLAVVTFQEGDRVDIVESKANIMGHKAKKIASYTISNNKLSKVKNRDITLEAKTGY
jgi:hypothetical protein